MDGPELIQLNILSSKHRDVERGHVVFPVQYIVAAVVTQLSTESTGMSLLTNFHISFMVKKPKESLIMVESVEAH